MSLFAEISCVVRLVFRARFAWVALGIFFATLVVMFFAAHFSGRQPATVSLDVGISCIRFLIPIFIVLLVQELFSGEFDRRFYLVSLAYPRHRNNFLFSRVFTILVLILSLVFLICVAQVLMVGFIGRDYNQSTPVSFGALYWFAISFLLIDLMVLTSLAVFLSVVASSTAFVLFGTLGFMVISRSYSSVVKLLVADSGLVDNSSAYYEGLGMLRYFLPDLGGMDIRSIALYGDIGFLPGDWIFLLFSTVSYALAFFALSVWAINCKRFA